MKLISMLVLGAAAAGGFVASRALLGRPEPPQGFPRPLQERVDAAHARLHRARARAAEAMAAGREERAQAEREMNADYLQRTGRMPSSDVPPGAAPLP